MEQGVILYDGKAILTAAHIFAGQDDLATMGVLNIYDNEEFALIPVELIEDSEAEPDEVFYMDVTNPIGGAFVGGAIKLSAIRTIIDDDWIA